MPHDLPAISRRVVDEVWNLGSVEAAYQVFEANYVNRDPSHAAGPVIGPLAMARFVFTTRQAFPDLKLTIEDQVAEGAKVVTRWQAQGTQLGVWGQTPPTRRKVAVTGITIDRFFGPRIVETWSYWDTLGMLQQLGLVPQT